MAVTTNLQAVLTLDNKQFLRGLTASQKAIDAFSKQLGKVNSQLAGLGRDMGKLGSINLKTQQGLAKSMTASTKASESLSNSISSVDGSSKGLTAQQLLLANAFSKSFSSQNIAGARDMATQIQNISGGGGLTGNVLQYRGAMSFLEKFGKKQVPTTADLGLRFTKEGAFNPANIKMYTKNVGEMSLLANKGTADIDGLTKAIGRNVTGLSNQSKALTGVSVGTAAYATVIGIAVGAIAAMTVAGIEMSKTYVEMNNAQRAFSRGFDFRDLDRMSEATGDMVTELDLMHTSIRAVNLGIDAAQLPLYFEFATIRAAETGEEVAKLVDQLIIGIGRKSTQRLDDLGLSLKRIQEEVRKTGDFTTAVGNIIQEEMSKSTVSVEDVASGAVQLGIAFDNLYNNLADSSLFGWFDTLAIKMTEIVNLANLLAKNKYDVAGMAVLADLGLSGKSQSELEGIRANFEAIVDRYPDYISYLKAVNVEIDLRKISGNWIDDKALIPFIDNLKAALKIYQDLAAAALTIDDYIKWKGASSALSEYINNLGKVEKATKDAFTANFFGIGGLIPEIEAEIALMEEKLKTLRDEYKIQQLLFEIELKRARLKEVKTLREVTVSKDSGIIPSIEGAIGNFEALARNTFDESLITNYYNQIGILTEYLDKLRGKLEEVNAEGINFSNLFGDLMMSAAVNFANSIVDIIEGKNILDAFKDFLSQMGRMMATYGALLIAQGVAQKAFEHGEAYTKIIAGAAMLALGLAVAASGSRINTAGGGGSSGNYGGSGMGGYDYDREIVLVARGQDLVAVLNRTSSFNYQNGP